MDLRLRRPAFWARLHLRSGLQGWDLARELALDATCDQLPPVAEEALPTAQLDQAAGGLAEALRPSLSEARVLLKHKQWVEVRVRGKESEDPGSATEAKSTLLPKEDTWSPHQACQNAKGIQFRSRKLRAQGGWPRPPLNYCILISLALSSSEDSSLTVQEIYKFTRHHFPFFRTAPEGWKNTVRHNLCFSSSFEKTTDFVCLEGNRKSRLWKLTTEGRRKFQEEAQALPEDMMGLVHQSMDKPELMQSLFRL
ncbi:forkhead box protein R1 [Protobothrops mucrosquamatus]|uniref:forkhead box protein R1 n=1 Tax=Protobothrops mucrosquamatus TaxID=103944 RepID=UPI000775F28A|nr:forkhead box protein R1 [Protobothrops mucrosquamatus]